ncbi:hypothetical protein HZI30_24750 [Serratia fonticola]|uniref:hypothetical protein n=1 Tax=Serratia fonticola TaxID=47917 RepID=UPI0015C5A38F|nr:hypothetical protein [Serratia fonticola]NXZ90133.1 hypothetical protein [Serratia fonticola]
MKNAPSRNTRQAINLAELIDDMPEEELITLHNIIVNRLNSLQRQRTRQSMEDFRPGDVVSFRTDDGQTVTGVLVRLNKKTVTVHTESGSRWNVAPQLLTRIKRQLGFESSADNTVEKKLH